MRDPLPYRLKKTEQSHRVYFSCFIVALVLCWSPLKSVAYLAPFICIAWFLFRSNSGPTFRKLLLVFSAGMLLVTFYYVLYRVVGEHFLVGNALVALVTYASFVFLLVIPAPPGEDEHYLKYAKILEIVVILESIVGIGQYLAAATTSMAQTDAVQGTISPLSFSAAAAGFGNQMFAINMLFALLFLLPYLLVHQKGKFAFLIGMVAVLFSSVVHVFFAFLVSVALGSFFFRKHLLFSQFKVILLALGTVVVLVGALAIYQPKVIRNIGMYYTIYSQGDSPKNQIVDASVSKLPDEFPLMYFFGLGPGQYSSRAGLISSGFYFSGFDENNQMAFLPNEMSPYFVKYVLPIWHVYAGNNAKYGNSTMSRPFFSLLSLYVEFGGLAFVLLLGYVGYLLGKLRGAFVRNLTNGEPVKRYLAMCCGMAILFVVFLALFENYLETTQAIFPGLVLVKIFFPSRLLASPTVSSAKRYQTVSS